MSSVINISHEQLLKQQFEKLMDDYQRLFDENPLPMLIADKKTSRFIKANNAALDTYGYAREEFFTLTLKDLCNSKRNINNGSGNHHCHYKKCGEPFFVEVKTSETIYKNLPAELITIIDVSDKVRTQEKEKSAKLRLQAIFEGTNDAILLTDNTGRYVQVNNTACSILEYTETELLALSVADIVVTNTVDEDYSSLWDKFIDTGTQTGIIEIKKKSGEIIICHYNATSNVLPGLHLSILTDITEREVARRKIEEQAKYIETIVEGITDCLFVVSNDWIIKYWNKAAEQLLHKKANEVLARHISKIHINGIGENFLREFEKAMLTKQPVQFEEYSTNTNLWLDVSVYPSNVGLTIYVKDITSRKKQTCELLHARNNQNFLINSTNDLIWSLDTDLKLVSFNVAYKNRIEQFLGFPAYEGLQLPAIFKNGKDRKKWISYYRKALEGKNFQIDEAFVDEGNSATQYKDIRFSPVYDTNTNTIIGVACHSSNITERVEHQLLIEEQNKKLILNEEHLQRLSAKLEKVMNSSLDIICCIDTNGRFVQVSNASSYVLGYTPAEITGRFLLEFVAPDHADSTKNANAQLKDGYDLIGFDNVLIHKNGDRVFLTWSARLNPEDGLIYAVARDATSLVLAENMKAAAEQRFTALVQKGADLVGILDTQGNYLYTSPNIERELGYAPEYLAQKNALKLIHPDDLGMVQAQLEKVVIGGEVKVTAFRFKHANGEWRWFETIATNQLDNPAINGIVVNSRDITSRKQIETERELMIKELLKSNADLKQFSFITSHNLRAPLSNITGILNIIDYENLNDYNKQMLEMLAVSSKQLQKTINDLSDILVIKNNVSVEVTCINLQESIDEVKSTFLNTLNDVCANISTNFQVPSIDFNKTYLQSILVNLVSNSIKYRSLERTLTIEVSSYRDVDGNIIFNFTDNGTGIDVNMHKNKLFGLYQRFHDHIDGHGLGLFIIKSQITALGGKIDIESQVDKGTTFTITFKNRGGGRQSTNNDSTSAPLQLDVF